MKVVGAEWTPKDVQSVEPGVQRKNIVEEFKETGGLPCIQTPAVHHFPGSRSVHFQFSQNIYCKYWMSYTFIVICFFYIFFQVLSHTIPLRSSSLCCKIFLQKYPLSDQRIFWNRTVRGERGTSGE